ncbi:hypothetical protein [Streptomyces sp. NRRL S-87]|uniref:hypothetical protein n=1 Tax=Streptomyces sp. NRRL S-87 TaxID=1463920 RepID=UPI000B1A4E3C|nr:hypothetical protein [Streptomyces sp. NRRL S-87]
MIDFENLSRLPLSDPDGAEAANAELRPVFDPVLRTFSVQLWKDGEPSGIHGLTDTFQYADEPLEAIDAFLADNGVRALTEDETVLLYAGLVRSKGGSDWLMLQMGAQQA